MAEEQARTRRERLERVVVREPAIWREANLLIASRTPKGYERAVALLTNLRDAAARVEGADELSVRLRELRAAHASKPSLIKRLDVAVLC